MIARPSQPAAADPALQLWLAHEDRLFELAYRMLGSVTDAQDVLQEAFLRLRSADPATLRRPGGWLTTVVTRLCLDHLASARVRRERYVGPWLPEPVTTAPDVADDVVLAESISAAFLVVLEALSPAERAAFVLHDVFGHPFSEDGRRPGRHRDRGHGRQPRQASPPDGPPRFPRRGGPSSNSPTSASTPRTQLTPRRLEGARS